jgi:hypothetical protein
MSESARITLDKMRNNLRMGGSAGCRRGGTPDFLIALDRGDAELAHLVDSINAKDGLNSFAMTNGRLTIYSANAPGMAQVDFEEVREKSVHVRGGVTANKLALHAKGGGARIVNPFMVIGDCEKAVAFRAAEIDITADENARGRIEGNSAANGFSSLPGDVKEVIFGRGAQVWGVSGLAADDGSGGGASRDAVSAETFELRMTDPVRRDLMGNPVFSLYYNDMEVAEGLEAFRVCATDKKGNRRVLGGSRLDYKSYALQPEGGRDMDGNKAAYDPRSLNQVEVDLVFASIRPRVAPEPTTPEITLCGGEPGDETKALELPGAGNQEELSYRLRRLYSASILVRGADDEIEELDHSEE